MTDAETTHKTDGGFGLRRVVDLDPSPRLEPDQIETDPAVIIALLDEIFRRPFLYDWYSRNHRRYYYAELWIEVILLRESDQDMTFWSLTYKADDLKAGEFFNDAEDDIVQKLLRRRGGSNVTTVITAAGLAMWRKGRKK
jgi:hypothetical protein